MNALSPTLGQLGWKPFFSKQVSAEEDGSCQPVRVMSVHRGMVTVLGEEFEDSISSSLPAPKGPLDRPTVGDWLLIERNGRNLVRILDRTSLLKRPAPGQDHRVQLIAANVDTLFMVTSCDQDFNVARIERYLALSREAGVRPVVVLTKADLSPTPGPFRRPHARSSHGCRSSWSMGAIPRVSPAWPRTAELGKRSPWWDHPVSASQLSSTR